jgi:hypothetical protein
MRWMNVVLIVSLLALSAWADPGSGTKFGFNPTRLQLAQTMGKVQQAPPEEGEAAQTEGRLVPGKALLLSAIIPGAGQFYAKNYIFAAAFLAIEVGAWYGVASYHAEGMDKEEEYIAFADDHWTYFDDLYSGDGDFGSYLDYEYWAASLFGPDGESGGTDGYTNDIGIWDALTWEEKLAYLPSNGFTHELDEEDKDQQYYEMIGKYDQFGAGWPGDGDYVANYRADKTVGDGWTWQTHNSYRENYLNMRKDSNDALDRSKNFTMVVLANHLLSALHAGFNVSMHNRKLAKEQAVEGAFNLEPKKYNDEYLAMGVLRIKF